MNPLLAVFSVLLSTALLLVAHGIQLTLLPMRAGGLDMPESLVAVSALYTIIERWLDSRSSGSWCSCLVRRPCQSMDCLWPRPRMSPMTVISSESAPASFELYPQSGPKQQALGREEI